MLVLLAGALVLVVAGVLALQVLGLVEDDGEPTGLTLNGRAAVARGEIADGLYVLRGAAAVAGQVEGDVIVLSGTARIDGRVAGDVVVVDGRAVLGRRAAVGGDVRAADGVVRRPGAEVGGQVEALSITQAAELVPVSLWWALWLAGGATVLLLAGGLRRRLARPALNVATAPLRSVALGLLAVVGAPLLLALLALTVVGSGVAVVGAAALVVALALGAGATAVATGGLVLGRRSRNASLLGWAALGALVAVALVVSPALAALACLAVVVPGVGGVLGALLDAAHPADRDDEPSAPEDEAPPEPAIDDAVPRVLVSLPILPGHDPVGSSAN